MSEKRAIAIGDKIRYTHPRTGVEYAGKVDTLYYDDRGVLMVKGRVYAQGHPFRFSVGLKPDKYEIAE